MIPSRPIATFTVLALVVAQTLAISDPTPGSSRAILGTMKAFVQMQVTRTQRYVDRVFARTVWVDDYGAAADGITNDSGAIIKASYALGARGGIVHISCGKSYFIGQSVLIGAPGVTLQGCFHHPTLFADSVAFKDKRFLGSVNTLGRLIRAPAATISIGMGGGLRDLAIIQQGVTIPMPDARTWAGTAVAVDPGGKGSAAHLDDVLIIGGEICFDASNGSTPAELRHVDGDCTIGAIAGQSAGGSVYEDIDFSVFGTQDFAGFPISSIVGDGKTTTVTFTYPQNMTAVAFPVGDLVLLPEVRSPVGQLYPSVYGYKITVSTVSGRTGTIEFASPVDTNSTAVQTVGRLFEYTRQYHRAGGIGMLFKRNVGCDDTHVGRFGDFGHDIAFDVQCHGIMNVDHIWADNNLIGVRVGLLPSEANNRGAQVGQVHFGSVFAADTGGVGLQINSPGSSQPSSVMIDKLSVIGISSDCVQVTNSILQFGEADVEGCSDWGFRPSRNSKVFGGSLHANLSKMSGQLILSEQSAENIQISHISTDGEPGTSIYGKSRRRPTMLASAKLLALPVNSINSDAEVYALSGSTSITRISACWGNRLVRFIITGTARFEAGGNIDLIGGAPIGGRPGTIVTFFCDSTTTLDMPIWRQTQ